MVLDIILFRKEAGGNPDLVRASQQRRFASVELVDEIIKLDEEWRKAKHTAEMLKNAINTAQKEIGPLMKAGKKDEAQALITENEERKKTSCGIRS